MVQIEEKHIENIINHMDRSEYYYRKDGGENNSLTMNYIKTRIALCSAIGYYPENKWEKYKENFVK